MYAWNDGTDVLMHHGIKGQKWGVRRFQNPDMTYTAAGKERYSWASRTGNAVKAAKAAKAKVNKAVAKVKWIKLTDNQKKALKIGAAVVGTALVAYGAYKVGTSPQVKQMIKNGQNAIADKLEEHDIKKRILDEMHMEIDDKYSKAAIDIESHLDGKLRKLYEQMEKVKSMRTKDNSAEVNKLIAELYNTRESIINERNQGLKDLQESYKISNAAHNLARLEDNISPLRKTTNTSKLFKKLINEGKDIHRYDERKINDLISGDNRFYNDLKSIGEDPESYGIKYRNSRIV